MAILLVLFCLFITNSLFIIASKQNFTPRDNYLINCGAYSQVTLPDNRVFISNKEAEQYFSTGSRYIQVSQPPDNVPSPIYATAKIFIEEAKYTFHVAHVGWHWIRFHFFPVNNNDFNLHQAKFKVHAGDFVLLHDFQVANSTSVVKKEYLVNVTSQNFQITFIPAKNTVAFVNALEFVSAPDILLRDYGSNLFPARPFSGLSKISYETMYRLDVGGPLVTSDNDTLGRTWVSDRPYLKLGFAAQIAYVKPDVIQYPDEGSPLIAPPIVYASAVEMAQANVITPNFNVTWSLEVDTSYSYLLRLHFCDIVSKSSNDLHFNVYIAGRMAISGLDLSDINSNELATAYYQDIVVNSSIINNPLTVQIGPLNEETGSKNAILNGLEVFKMNNSVGSLNGEYGIDGKKDSRPNYSIAMIVGFVIVFGACLVIGTMVVKWKKRHHNWEKRNSFSSWLLPLHAGDTSFMSSKTSTGSLRSQFYSSTMVSGRYFSIVELQDATKSWDSSAIIGVGGFGNVYIGEIDDGTKVAVKRGSPQSEQGINEFRTEIQMLSKLRHRHLVSLIGYCDENSEMILVYEYMSNGPLRDHLYGKNLPSLSWKQRLEICIGAARGLHYLHTGLATGIIHRDVKTTNILLDDAFIAKMADFGLSKYAPATAQAHVSTAVKGSFGYLDPDYFRKQQLTDKSDVYSFGVVLLEVLCARPVINPQLPREQVNLIEWAMQWKHKGLLDKIIDPSLVGRINPESLKKFAEAAEKCLAEYGVDRPTMGDVLWNLEYALQLQQVSSQDKAEEENKAYVASPAVVTPSSATPTSDSRPICPPEVGKNHAEVQAIDEHSGTVFSKFATLNGR